MDIGETKLALNRSGVWEIRWTERGRTRSASCRTKDRALAEKVRRGWIQGEKLAAAVGAGAGGTGTDGPSVGVILDGYEAGARKRGVGKTTLRAVVELRRVFGAYVVGDLDRDTVESYGDARPGVDQATLRRELNVLVAALRWGEKVRLVPVGGVPVIELPPGGEARVVWLDEAEDARLFAAGAAAARSGSEGGERGLGRAGLFACIGLDTGARKAAIQGLTWDRVDLVRETIDFRDPGVRTTKKRRVMTPITARLMPVLRDAWDRHTGRFVLGHRSNVGPMFGELVGGLGMEHVTPHVLRHTRVTLLLRAGVSAWDVSKLVGTSAAMIELVYGHGRVDDRLRAQANRRAA